jgi:hypothetical protein
LSPGDAVVQPQIVELCPVEPQPAVPPGDQPGDGALDHRPVLAVDSLEIRALGADPVRTLQGLVRVQ